MKRLKISVNTITPKEGDIIIARCLDSNETMDRPRKILEVLDKAFPNNEVIVLPSDYRIQQVEKEQFWKFIEALKNLRPKEEREENNS